MAARKQRVRMHMMKRLSSSISELLSVSRKTLTEETEPEGIPGLHQAALMGNQELIKMMIRSDAVKLDETDSKGMTAVHYSCLQPNSEVTSALLQAGCSVDVQNSEGDTATHIACKHGHKDTVSILLYYRSNPTIRNKQGKTAFDLSCEYGKSLVAHLLLNSGIDQSCFAIPSSSRQELYLKKDGVPLTHGFHLAARNGHLDILSILVDAGWNPNLMLPNGSALHEAAAQGQIDSVRFLLQAGADSNIENSFGQTVADVVKKHGYKHPTVAKEIKALFKESRTAVYGRAILDYSGISNLDLSFVNGEVIWILDRSDDHRWRGTIFGPKFQSRSGYFPPSSVQIIDRQTGMQRSLSQRQVKKVGVPTVPDVAHNPLDMKAAKICDQSRDGRQSSSSYGSGESGLGSNPAQHSPLRTFSSGKNVENGRSKRLNGVASPRHRNSTGSNCSQTSSGFESMQSSSQPQMNVTVHTLRGDRDSPPSRNSVHSSDSSSLGSSLERLDESGYASQVNIAEMILNGVPDSEVLTAWLHDLRYEEYVPLFLNAGYDLPTVARMTPEDLTAIGITKPGHRKRITTEIHKLAVKENWPSVFPLDAPIGVWLNGLNLTEYTKLFECQGYKTVSNVYQLTWEDFEDVGVKKLGHLKKLGLALKSLKDHRHSMNVCSESQHSSHAVTSEPTNTQVLLINVPHTSSNRNLAEVRPYAHKPSSPLPPKSPRPSGGNAVSTFANGSPLRRPLSTEILPNMSGYDTFPRRDNRSKCQVNISNNAQTASVYGTPHPPGRRQMITTEVVVHQTSCRPTVTVRPQPTAKSTENIENKQYYANSEMDIETIKKQAVHEYLMQQAGLGHNSGNYAMLHAPANQSYTNDYCDGPVYANFEPASGYRAPLSPRLMAGSQSSPLRRKSQMPPPPPRRAAPQNCGHAQDHCGGVSAVGAIYCPLSSPANGDQLSVANGGLSPSSSMEEFPPPPSPLQCEASIRTLRSVMTSSDVNMATAESANNSSSTSSTETLAFAQENVGTIKSRGATNSTSDVNRRNVKDIFASTNAYGKGETLDDIDDMLQNLTAELNAMLTPDTQKTAVK